MLSETPHRMQKDTECEGDNAAQNRVHSVDQRPRRITVIKNSGEHRKTQEQNGPHGPFEPPHFVRAYCRLLLGLLQLTHVRLNLL